MIAVIQGEIFEVQEDSFIIMVNGVGYQVFSPVANLQPVPAVGETILLYTHYYLREDACMLFGFMNRKELKLFQMLLSVNGIGAKTALVMLNTLSYQEIIQGIQFGNTLLLTKIPGIGKKTAERVLLEMKDKVAKLEPEPMAAIPAGALTQQGTSNSIQDNIKNTAVTALVQLGYSGTLATRYVVSAMEESPADAPLETIITTALRLAANN